jgi:hypothetical protein
VGSPAVRWAETQGFAAAISIDPGIGNQAITAPRFSAASGINRLLTGEIGTESAANTQTCGAQDFFRYARNQFPGWEL